jgi:hypothetical protein
LRWDAEDRPGLLLAAFNRAFRADEPARLIARINNPDPRADVAAAIAGLPLAATGGRISYLVNRRFPHYQLGSLYRSADCFVAVGASGGWDPHLIQAMACGVPAIATDWGSNREFMHAGIAYPLAVAAPAGGSGDAEPDGEHLAHLLRHVYENRRQAAGIGAGAARALHAEWTWGTRSSASSAASPRSPDDQPLRKIRLKLVKQLFPGRICRPDRAGRGVIAATPSDTIRCNHVGRWYPDVPIRCTTAVTAFSGRYCWARPRNRAELQPGGSEEQRTTDRDR